MTPSDWDKRVQIAAEKFLVSTVHPGSDFRSDNIVYGFKAGANFAREELGKFGDAMLKCEALQAEVERLKEFEWMYKELCK